jgi:CRISPR-associated protein Csb1
MNPKLDLATLQSAVAGSAAAFRCRRRLQPAGGEGDKIFPPTFAGAVYVIEQRRVPGREQPVTCVLLDSVQSQANRMEEALQEALDRGELQIPSIEVDFSKADLLNPVGRVTSLQTPHRIADAILRDSNYDGQPFRKSSVGKELDFASATNATSLYRLCPTALLFGMWDSTGPKGGLGVKFERAMVSEVVGVGVPPTDSNRNRGLRRDPLNISKSVAIRRKPDGDWEVAGLAKEKGLERPSEINHSNVPFETDNSGVTIEYAEQTTTLSLIALRRLCFPAKAAEASKPEVDDAARAVIAALGLCAATLAFETGMGLRSRCLLWPEAPLTWELLEKPGTEPAQFSLDCTSAISLLENARAAAENAGIEWRKDPLVLEPKLDLVKLVRLSQEELVKKGVEAE